MIFAIYVQSTEVKDDNNNHNRNESLLETRNNSIHLQQTLNKTHKQGKKFSSKIVRRKNSLGENFFGTETFIFGKSSINDAIHNSKINTSNTKATVLDFRIKNHGGKQSVKKNSQKDDKKKVSNDEDTMIRASAGAGKERKESDNDEEKTLAQQVADGKYGLIQNELFANGSKRPGILSYRSNNEVPKDTKDNLGGLEKDEIWLAEDHVLVLRGGNLRSEKENETTSSSVWPPIDNFKAPNRQVKIPKNPDIPPPFPVQLSEDGPIQFIKGKNNPSFLPPIAPPQHPFETEVNKTIPLPFTVSPIPPSLNVANKSLPFPVPPHFIPPFLNNFPPGATFVLPPDNTTDIDEDDPSIYYPPKYDFLYPIDNTTAVPPGPLVPGIILPPPPNFFSLLENNNDSSIENHENANNSINSVTPNSNNIPPKYLPPVRKPGRGRIPSNTYAKKPIAFSSNNTTNTTSSKQKSAKPQKPAITYVYPDKFKQKLFSSTTPSYKTFNKNNKIPINKITDGFISPIYVPSNQNESHFHYPLPTTSPKPNHITLPPTTKSLPKQILIITTPESVNKNELNSFKKAKPINTNEFENKKPEIHPLKSLVKPNVTVSYNGKYGHLPLPHNRQANKPELDSKLIQGQFVSKPTLTKDGKEPSTEINSITVTPIPVVKKIRIESTAPEKSEIEVKPINPSGATLYFYEETSNAKEEVKQDKFKDSVVNAPPITLSGKPELQPVTPYYYTTHSTSKTPIRQYLEETFHSSNILLRKPQIAQVQHAEIITHNGYSDIPKMKHLNYGSPVSSPRPVVKYHYVADGNPVTVPTPKIKDLEIKNSGSTGLQTIRLDPVSVRPAPKPLITESKIPEQANNQASLTKVITSSNLGFNPPDGPFIPSNYYSTVRPEHFHFTSQEQTLVDDITKNYFTIFGQKINNSPSTTPLTPVVKPNLIKTKPNQESGLTYISDDGLNFKIQQLHQTSGKTQSQSTSSITVGENLKPTPTRPPSNFEKYLKELTGEDQREYIVSGLFPIKIKKGKGFLNNEISQQLISHPSIANTNPNNVQYKPNLPTTLRPVTNVEIQPQYIQPISSTPTPINLYHQHNVQPLNIHFNPSLQQYFHEFSSLSSPTTKRPTKLKNPNLDYVPKLSPLNQYQNLKISENPIPLTKDVLVNFKPPRPSVEQNAETINSSPPFNNIQIVSSPDLSRNPNQQFLNNKQLTFDVGKVLFQNIGKPGFFPQPIQQNGPNSFVSYSLPGNVGHFYFLTPQIIEKEYGQENRDEKNFKRVNRSREKENENFPDKITTGYSGQIQQEENSENNNRNYPRRRRKKT